MTHPDASPEPEERWMLRLALRLSKEKPRYLLGDALLRSMESTAGGTRPLRRLFAAVVDLVCAPFGARETEATTHARDLLRRSIATLDGNDRRLVALRYQRRLSFLALSAEVGLLSYRSARRRVHRAEESLRRKLEREAGADWPRELHPLAARAQLVLRGTALLMTAAVVALVLAT